MNKNDKKAKVALPLNFSHQKTLVGSCSRVEQIASVRPGSDFKVIVCQDSRQSDCVITAAEDLPGSG